MKSLQGCFSPKLRWPTIQAVMLSKKHQRSNTVQEEGLTNEARCHFLLLHKQGSSHMGIFSGDYGTHQLVLHKWQTNLVDEDLATKLTSALVLVMWCWNRKKLFNPSSPLPLTSHPSHSYHHTFTVWSNAMKGTIRWNPAPIVPFSKAPPCEGVREQGRGESDGEWEERNGGRKWKEEVNREKEEGNKMREKYKWQREGREVKKEKGNKEKEERCWEGGRKARKVLTW